jgi:hypothetical protein
LTSGGTKANTTGEPEEIALVYGAKGTTEGWDKMKRNEISQFMNLFRRGDENIFINGFSENMEGTICGIKFDSQRLLLLPDKIKYDNQ